MTRLEYHCLIKGNCLEVDRVLPKANLPQELVISFKRTVRVPDNKESSQLPPDFGEFALYKIQDYAERLSQDTVDKKGVFLHMHQKEAMWIDFSANAPFMIKIYCGGVNVVSGEHAAESIETRQRRLKLLGQGKPIQDYVVVPEQPWLDGVAIKPSIVRQFTGMPTGQGYTVEAQLTGEESVGELSFEVTPALYETKDPIEVYVKTLAGETYTVKCSPYDDVQTIKSRLQIVGKFPIDQQRLVYAGRQLDDDTTLKDHGIQEGASLRLALRVRAGSVMHVSHELGIAPGGLINQYIRKDTRDPQKWVRRLNLSFSVRILDSLTFRKVTGLEPPPCPLDAETYAKANLPFYDLYEERATDVSGAEAFGALQSVNEIDTIRGLAAGPEPIVNPRIIKLHESSLSTAVWNSGDVFHIVDLDGLLSPGGPRRAFRTLADLETETRDLSLGP